MSIYQFKKQFQNLLRPISDTLVKKGVTANQVTISSVVLSAVVARLVFKHAKNSPVLWYVLPTGLFVRMAMNAIDGMMAKEHHQASTLGAWLNETGDLLSDAFLLGGLLPHIATQNHHALYRVMALSSISELVAIWVALTTGERANHGPMGKSDRALVLGVWGVCQALGKTISPKQQQKGLLLMQLLLIITIYRRCMAYQT